MLNWNLPETAQICETFSLFSFTTWSPDSNDDDEYNRLVYKLKRYAKIRKLLIIFFSTILRIIYIMIRNFELSSCKNILYQWKRNHLLITFYSLYSLTQGFMLYAIFSMSDLRIYEIYYIFDTYLIVLPV